jgi:hypothetical protein
MRHFEEWLAFLAAQLPDPVNQEEHPDGSVWFTGGEPGQVIARLTRSTITVFEFTVVRDGSRTPVVTPRRIGTVAWRRARNNEMVRAVSALIDAARQVRLAKFTVCVQCERPTPPEAMSDEDICQSCAEGERGLVH